MSLKIGINGMGVLGRRLLRMAYELNASGSYVDNINITQINDPKMSAEQLVYLLKHDTVYGKWDRTITVGDKGEILIDNVTIPFTHIAYDSSTGWSDCLWQDTSSEFVVDCMGIDAYEKQAIMQSHIQGGAKFVLCCGNGMDNTMPAAVFGVNHTSIDKAATIIAINNGDVQAAAVISKLLNDEFTVENAIIENVCSYTNLNNLEDSAKSGFATTPQVGRAGAWNIIPCSSSATKKMGLVIPVLKGKVVGRELRAGTIAGSFLNITASLTKDFDADTFYGSVKAKIDNDLANAYKGELICAKYDEDYLNVSSDAIGEPCVIVNRDYLALTTNFVNVQVLYDAISLQAGNAILMATYIRSIQ